MIEIQVHDVVESTQRLALDVVRTLDDHTALAIRAGAQRIGMGREGRRWHDPPGAALLVSVAVRGPLPVAILDGLPRHCVDVLIAALVYAAPAAGDALAWKPPNDVIDSRSGAKLAGVLIDTQIQGDVVEHAVVGIGANVGGSAFVTVDGRAATTLETIAAVGDLEDETVARIAEQLVPALVRTIRTGARP